MTRPGVRLAGARLVGFALRTACVIHSAEAGQSCIAHEVLVCRARVDALVRASNAVAEYSTEPVSVRYNREAFEAEWPTPPEELVHPMPSPEDLLWQLRHGDQTSEDLHEGMEFGSAA